MKAKMTIAPVIGEAISKAYSGLHQCFQDLKNSLNGSEVALTKLQEEDEGLQEMLNLFYDSLVELKSKQSSQSELLIDTIKYQDSKIERLEKRIGDLERTLRDA